MPMCSLCEGRFALKSAGNAHMRANYRHRDEVADSERTLLLCLGALSELVLWLGCVLLLMTRISDLG